MIVEAGLQSFAISRCNQRPQLRMESAKLPTQRLNFFTVIFLRCDDFWLQNLAILRNAVRMVLVANTVVGRGPATRQASNHGTFEPVMLVRVDQLRIF